MIVGCYDSAADDFASQFTEYMAQQYSDLQVTVTMPNMWTVPVRLNQIRRK